MIILSYNIKGIHGKGKGRRIQRLVTEEGVEFSISDLLDVHNLVSHLLPTGFLTTLKSLARHQLSKNYVFNC